MIEKLCSKVESMQKDFDEYKQDISLPQRTQIKQQQINGNSNKNTTEMNNNRGFNL